MEAFRARQFAKAGAAPNTFIDGTILASEPLNTPYKLAQKLGISVNRIDGFKIKSNDVECRIRENYNFPASPFNSSIFINNEIKEWNDVDGLVVGDMPYNTFRGTGIEYAFFPNITALPGLNEGASGAFRECSSLIEFHSDNLQRIGYRAFDGCVNLEVCPTENITTIQSGGFANCEKLPIDDLTALTTIGNGARHFLNCKSIINMNFTSVTFVGSVGGNSDFAMGCSELTEVTFSVLENVNTVITGFRAFANCNKLEKMTFSAAKTLLFNDTTPPNVITNNGMFNSATPIKELLFPELEEMSGTFNFLKQLSSCELIDAKKCKTFYVPDAGYNYMFQGLKSGCVIKVHEDNLTNNGSGGVNNCLQEAKDVRGATVEFYDDNGDYVSTL